MTDTNAFRPTILVVEMNEKARRLFYRTFQQAGYNVLLASSGEAAIKLYRGVQSRVVVVLLSAHRPGLNGRRLLAALQEINPTLRCVIATEVTPDDEVLPLVRQGAAGLLVKPLNLNEALAVVSRVMEGDWITPVRRTTRRRSARTRSRSTSLSK
jgi:DNA-binding NtrC family response regulator